MRIFVSEFVCGGGWYAVEPNDLPSGTLLAEGCAMLQAALRDCVSLREHEIATTLDARVAQCVAIPEGVRVIAVTSAAEERAAFEREVAASDAAWIIAPELSRYLLDRTATAQRHGITLLQPGEEFARIAGDKWETYRRLQQAGVPVPRTFLLSDGDELNPPFVTKPRCGCGSLNVLKHSFRPVITANSELIVQEFVPGMPASISVVAGPNGVHFCPASRQLLSDEGCFTYHGGELPLSDDLQRRAERLARLVAEAMPPAQGYFGIDLVLGENESGDRVIEVNARLTTSYVGLRRLFRGNLAEAILATAKGQPFEFAWDARSLRFTTDGECRFSDE